MATGMQFAAFLPACYREGSSRTLQPQRGHAMEYVRTWADEQPLNMHLGELVLFDKSGKPLCLLRNNPLERYKKQKLPWFGTAQIPHHLLAHLKTAHCFALLQAQLLSASLPSGDLEIYVVYESDMENPDDSSTVAFRKWCKAHPGSPLLISGVSILGPDNIPGYLDLSLSYKNPPGPDYSKVLNLSFFAPLLVAIRCYNDIVEELLRHGFPVISVLALDELAAFSAALGTVGGLPIIDI